MRKEKIAAGLLAVGLLCMGGCNRAGPSQDKPPEPPARQEEELKKPTKELEAPSFGAYEVPQGWVIAPQYSSEQKLFYVQQGQEQAAQPDNISVEEGHNRYTKEEHELFRQAILSQLLMQTRSQPSAELEGSGGLTAAGDILYVFTIREKGDGVVTRQYYIVGEKRYCLIHETNFTGSPEVDAAAQSMADSFVWQ